jgi:hypothetical protein
VGSLAEAPHSDHRHAGTDFLTLRRLTPRRAAFHSGNNTRLMSAEKALGIVTLPKAVFYPTARARDRQARLAGRAIRSLGVNPYRMKCHTEPTAIPRQSELSRRCGIREEEV